MKVFNWQYFEQRDDFVRALFQEILKLKTDKSVLVISSKIFALLATNDWFLSVFDPTTKYEEAARGNLGTVMNMILCLDVNNLYVNPLTLINTESFLVPVLTVTE